MTTKHLLDPELHTIIDAFPDTPLIPKTLPAFRRAGKERIVMGDPEKAGVVREEVFAEAVDGYQVRCLLYVPDAASLSGAGYVHVHGGGYVMGSADGSDLTNLAICKKLGVVVLSVDYRLAPEHPIPAPLDDCYAGLRWLHEHADQYGLDTARIGIGGESAGGGLAAALCHQGTRRRRLSCLPSTPDVSNVGQPDRIRGTSWRPVRR